MELPRAERPLWAASSWSGIISMISQMLCPDDVLGAARCHRPQIGSPVQHLLVFCVTIGPWFIPRETRGDRCGGKDHGRLVPAPGCDLRGGRRTPAGGAG